MTKHTNSNDLANLAFSINDSHFTGLKMAFKCASSQDVINEMFALLEWIKDEVTKGRMILSSDQNGENSVRLTTKGISALTPSTSPEKIRATREFKSTSTQTISIGETVRSDYLYGLMLNFGFDNKYELVEEGLSILNWIRQEVDTKRKVGSCNIKPFGDFQPCPWAIKAEESKSFHDQTREEAVQFIDKLML